MACGLPCIISDIPAFRENFQHVAVLVRPDDVEGFAKAILNLLKDDRGRRRFAEKSVEFVRQFTWKRVAKRELTILKAIIKK
jgi:glycosyltransferase involved in cell wall biosynthesis